MYLCFCILKNYLVTSTLQGELRFKALISFVNDIMRNVFALFWSSAIINTVTRGLPVQVSLTHLSWWNKKECF